MHFDLCPKHAGPGEGGCPLCAFDHYESTIKAMTETATEQGRVHVEMHGDLVVQDELILKLGGRIKGMEARVAELEADAKRYRALRDSGKYGVARIGRPGWCLGGGDSAADLDAAADQLIQA